MTERECPKRNKLGRQPPSTKQIKILLDSLCLWIMERFKEVPQAVARGTLWDAAHWDVTDIHWTKRKKKILKLNSPGGPVVKSLGSHCRGHKFHPTGEIMCTTALCSQKERKTKPKRKKEIHWKGWPLDAPQPESCRSLKRGAHLSQDEKTRPPPAFTLHSPMKKAWYHPIWQRKKLYRSRSGILKQDKGD